MTTKPLFYESPGTEVTRLEAVGLICQSMGADAPDLTLNEDIDIFA